MTAEATYLRSLGPWTATDRRFGPISRLGKRDLIGGVSACCPSQGWRLRMSELERSSPTQREADKVS
jgi:hypothetical protein